MKIAAPTCHPERGETAAGRLSSDGKSQSLPAGWTRTTLGHVVDILDSQRVPINSDERAKRPGNIPYFGATGQVGLIDTHLFDEELVLLGEDGAPFLDNSKPKAYMIRGKTWVNNHAHVLRAKPGILNSFVLHQLNQVDYHKFVSGTTRMKLPQGPMRQIPMLVVPEPEQRRIVAEIEKQFTRLEAGVAALRRVQANLHRYRAAVLKAACEGDWPRTTVEEVAEEVRYGTSAKTNEDKSGVPVLRMGNIVDGSLDFTKLKFLPRKHTEFPDLLLKHGDIVFNRTNSAELVGKTAVYHGTPSPCSFASYLIRVRVKPSYQPDFLSYYLNSVYGRQWVASVVSQQVGQANVNGTKLKALEIPNPPLAEQERIVAEVERRLSVVEELSVLVESNLKRATRLRQAVLQKAFEGKLI
jgi:type I restriction enzyme S subunit